MKPINKLSCLSASDPVSRLKHEKIGTEKEISILNQSWSWLASARCSVLSQPLDDENVKIDAFYHLLWAGGMTLRVVSISESRWTVSAGWRWSWYFIFIGLYAYLLCFADTVKKKLQIQSRSSQSWIEYMSRLTKPDKLLIIIYSDIFKGYERKKRSNMP